MRVLCGDMGGTHSRLAVALVEQDRVRLERVVRRRNADYPDCNAILAEFLTGESPFDACTLAVAGPTDGRRVRFTNLDWTLDADDLASRFSIPRTGLVNDFAAVGWGLNGLEAPDLAVLQAGLFQPGAPRVAWGPARAWG